MDDVACTLYLSFDNVARYPQVPQGGPEEEERKKKYLQTPRTDRTSCTDMAENDRKFDK